MSEHFNKFKSGLMVLLIMVLLIMVLPLFTFAQGDTPADGCDPYDGCQVPLDTWVIALAVIALAYGAYQLHCKKALTAS